MHVENGKKRITKYLRWLGIGFSITLWIWSIWPSAQITQVISYSEVPEIFQTTDECHKLTQLINSDMALLYPRSVRFMEVVDVVLTIGPKQTVKKGSDEECSVVLEANLNLPEVNIEPGSRIIMPLIENQAQIIRFRITADRREEVIAGNLLIHAQIISTQNVNQPEERIPLFAIPVRIRLHDYFGIPFSSLRLGSLILLLFILMGPRMNRWFR